MRSTTFGVVVAMLVSSIAGGQFVQQGGKLVATGTVGAAGVGAVAVSADGNTVIVGGPGDNNDIGAAWVFIRSGGVWTQQGAKLVGTGAEGTESNQGASVALSADGSTVIVGGPGDDGGQGAAWVFTRSDGVWTQQGNKLVGTGAGCTRANQGTAVALSADGHTAIIGGPGPCGTGGAAWVFTRSDGAWTQQGEKLVGADAENMGYWYPMQGASVAISADGNTVVVGGPADGYWGAAWIFTRSDGAWTQQGEKLVGTGMVGDMHVSALGSVALSADGNTVLLGRPWDDGDRGATWVFTRSTGAWAQQGGKLVGTGSVEPHQGTSVSLSADGDLALVGGPGGYGFTGATWVFTRSGGEWKQHGQMLVGTCAAGQARQGSSLSLSADGDTAVVGGPGDDENTGAVWVFTRQGDVDGTLWVPVVAHTAGLGDSRWRSDLGLLNVGNDTANVQLTFHGAGGAMTNTTYVPPGAQSILVDVVAQLAASGQGALEIVSDEPLRVTSRTYRQAPGDASCNPYGSQGQSFPAMTANDGLSESESAWLPHLTENAMFRTNIGLANMGSVAAEATVELWDGSGALLASYAVALAPGEWKQETQPFRKRAGLTSLQCGYAKVTVTAGAGVVALASVVDNITNDPTTITMQR